MTTKPDGDSWAETLREAALQGSPPFSAPLHQKLMSQVSAETHCTLPSRTTQATRRMTVLFATVAGLLWFASWTSQTTAPPQGSVLPSRKMVVGPVARVGESGASPERSFRAGMSSSNGPGVLISFEHPQAAAAPPLEVHVGVNARESVAEIKIVF